MTFLDDPFGCPIQHSRRFTWLIRALTAVLFVVFLANPAWWSLWLFVTWLVLALTHPGCRLLHRHRDHQETR